MSSPSRGVSTFSPIELVDDRFDLVLWILRSLPDVRLAQEAEEHRRRQVVPQRSFADLHPPTKCCSIFVGLDDRVTVNRPLTAERRCHA